MTKSNASGGKFWSKTGVPVLLNKGELTALLGGWEGYSLGTVGRMEPDEAQGRNEPELWLELSPGRIVMPAVGDLLFAAAFTRWLAATAQPPDVSPPSRLIKSRFAGECFFGVR